ncbi:MAG: AlpA family transcriptional regulator [Gammaproteobacteria bacterium CG_4_10_14_0_8_um_filter_38_16]|nr:MAG: AlpA family transcriptional regulator [Gammaproteobacteria bacterium CG_4_10_14_0_8_um_filter_38_16]PJA04166.1 MAG: AlpA family transcriptional regulator [Gammaproteobacteria bacterium CG_4_10_14_0_2_um_filter_38_22]PJB10107.1 MAG: AlpA family transcriptional regulator [Gammaproteobacteria bacterium CG_4_9_14_3_um_filter_38_9]
MSQTILRLPTVKSRTGLSRSSIYLKISQNAFPHQIKIGERQAGWIESEIDSWIEQRINESRTNGVTS